MFLGVEIATTKAVSKEQRPAPGGGPGSLTIIDNRTGKKYDIKVKVPLRHVTSSTCLPWIYVISKKGCCYKVIHKRLYLPGKGTG